MGSITTHKFWSAQLINWCVCIKSNNYWCKKGKCDIWITYLQLKYHTLFYLFIPGGEKKKGQRRMKRISGTVQYSPSIMYVSGHQPAHFYNSWPERRTVLVCQQFPHTLTGSAYHSSYTRVCGMSTASTHTHTQTQREIIVWASCVQKKNMQGNRLD